MNREVMYGGTGRPPSKLYGRSDYPAPSKAIRNAQTAQTELQPEALQHLEFRLTALKEAVAGPALDGLMMMTSMMTMMTMTTTMMMMRRQSCSRNSSGGCIWTGSDRGRATQG